MYTWVSGFIDILDWASECEGGELLQVNFYVDLLSHLVFPSIFCVSLGCFSSEEMACIAKSGPC